MNIEIILTLHDIRDREAWTHFIATRRLVAKGGEEGLATDLTVEWSDPNEQIGMWDSLVEWVGTISFSGMTADVVANLLATYLWWLISTKKAEEEERLNPSQIRPDTEIPVSPPIATVGASSFIHISIIDQGRRIDFDPKEMDDESLRALVTSFINEQQPSANN